MDMQLRNAVGTQGHVINSGNVSIHTRASNFTLEEHIEPDALIRDLRSGHNLCHAVTVFQS